MGNSSPRRVRKDSARIPSGVRKDSGGRPLDVLAASVESLRETSELARAELLAGPLEPDDPERAVRSAWLQGHRSALVEVEGLIQDLTLDSTVRFTVPVVGVPPSYNRTRYSRSWQQTRRLHSPFRDALTFALRGARDLPRPAVRIVASAELTFATRRRRDEGNYRTPIEKLLGDVLVDLGILPDDTPEHYRVDTVKFSSETGPDRTVLDLAVTVNPARRAE